MKTCTLAVLVLLLVAATVSAQCPGGVCRPATGYQTAPQIVYYSQQAANPCPAGVCANCPCSGGNCPPACNVPPAASTDVCTGRAPRRQPLRHLFGRLCRR